MKKSVMPGVMQFDVIKYFGQRMAAFRIVKRDVSKQARRSPGHDGKKLG
jgi:hypothetical protein